MNILSVDIGTTLIKCALVGTDGFTLITSGEYSTRTEGKISEQDAHAWWTTVVKCIKELLAMNPKATVEAICVGSQGITFVPVDRKGEPLCSAITWIDGRAETQVLQIQDKLAQERIFSIIINALSAWMVVTFPLCPEFHAFKSSFVVDP